MPRRRTVCPLIAVVVAVLAAAGCSGAGPTAPSAGARTTSSASATGAAGTQPVAATASATITVANKVAIGSQSYVEDSTPAYLSTVPQPFCASHGCQVPESALVTGMLVNADCTDTGAQMYNFDLKEQGARNPHAVASNLWYHVVLPHDVTGFLSEVYVDAGFRGGRGLPTCG